MGRSLDDARPARPGTRSPAVRSQRRAASAVPPRPCQRGWRIVVRCGALKRGLTVSGSPTTETSSGTRNPRSPPLRPPSSSPRAWTTARATPARCDRGSRRRAPRANGPQHNLLRAFEFRGAPGQVEQSIDHRTSNATTGFRSGNSLDMHTEWWSWRRGTRTRVTEHSAACIRKTGDRPGPSRPRSSSCRAHRTTAPARTVETRRRRSAASHLPSIRRTASRTERRSPRLSRPPEPRP